MRVRERSSGFVPALLWVAILVCTAWLYWPGISGPPILDDRASVTVLNTLEKNPEYAIDYIVGDRAGPLGRPVSMFSFVMEKLFLDDGIRGGKRVNIVLHLINGSLLLWLMSLLLAYIRIPDFRYLAVLGASAWILSPLYVSTVLYVVQRMAMLAAFFMLAACIAYVYWRYDVIKRKDSIAKLFLVVIFSVLGIFAKETAIVVVPVVLLMELFWFQFIGPDGGKLDKLRTWTLGLILLGATFLLVFFTLRYDWLIESYASRTYTVSERLLTQSRILWDYIAQLLSPEVSRMGVYHDDVMISTSLLHPMTTLYATISWLSIIGLSVASLRWKKARYLGFAAVVFLVGHSTESTLLPLELYYEHRNYFPGTGVFLLIAVSLGFLFKKWPEVAAPAMVWCGVGVLILAMRTSSQVQIWSSPTLLYVAHVSGHPESFRANTDFASMLAEARALPQALRYSALAHQSRPSERQGDYDIRDLALSCAANQPLSLERIEEFGMADPQRPLGSVTSLNVLVRQLQDDLCPSFSRVVFADRMATIFLGDTTSLDQDWKSQYKPKASPNIYASLAVLENSLERYEKAYQYTERFLLGSPGSVRGLLMKLHFAIALNKSMEIDQTFKRLLALEESGMLTLADQKTLSLYEDN